MMIQERRFMLLLAGAILTLSLGGCFLKKEEGQDRTVLIHKAQVAEEMKGWVAVPNHPLSKIKAPKDAKWKSGAYRMATHDVIPGDKDGWFAMNPKTFFKYTQIKLEPLNTKPGELWEMRTGRRVPEEKNGWIGVPLAYPKVQQKGDFGLAVLSANVLVSKEMDGWVCVDGDTLADMARKLEMKKTTIKKKKGAEAVVVPDKK